MYALPQIDHFQPVLDLAESILKIISLTVIDVFLLQRSDKAFDQTILGGTGFVGQPNWGTP